MISSIVLFIGLAVLVTLLVRHLKQQTRVERNARTETERQLRKSDRLQQLTAALSRARTPAEVITTSLPELVHATEGAAGNVYVAADDGRGLELAHAVGGGSSSDASRAVAEEAVRARDLFVREAEIGVPLIMAGRPIGAVVLQRLHTRRLDDDEREFLLSAGRHM